MSLCRVHPRSQGSSEASAKRSSGSSPHVAGGLRSCSLALQQEVLRPPHPRCSLCSVQRHEGPGHSLLPCRDFFLKWLTRPSPPRLWCKCQRIALTFHLPGKCSWPGGLCNQQINFPGVAGSLPSCSCVSLPRRRSSPLTPPLLSTQA